jgi:hypothetical protein
MIDDPQSELKPLWPYVLMFLIGLPAAGAVFGYVFFLILDFATGPLSYVGLKISVVVWAAFGAVAGIYATYSFRQTDKAIRRLQSNDS